MNIIDFALSKARVFVGILLFIIVAGAATYVNIPKEAAPDVNIPIIYISLSQNGISAEDSERLLVKPIEDEVKSVEGIKEVRSTAYSGGGNVLLEFDAGFNADQAMQDIRAKVDRAKGDLPNEADEPTVNEVNISTFPILLISLVGDLPDRTLQDLAVKLQDEIETIGSVLEAKIGGKRNEQVEILIDKTALESYGIDLQVLINTVQQNNMMVSAGGQDTGDGSFSIKVPGLFETIEDVLNTPIKTSGDSVITFKDIAKIKRTFEDRQSYANVNGSNSVTIEVSKRIGENIIQTIDEVKNVTSKVPFPPNVKVLYSQDQSKTIKTMLSSLQNNVIAAIILVLIIILGALGLRFIFSLALTVTEINSDHVQYAEIASLSKKKIVYAYVVRNTMLPQITDLGMSLAYMFEGALITEVVFGYPGIGYALYRGVISADYNLIMGVTLLSIIGIATASLIIDLIYPLFDPRVRYK